MLKQIDDQSEMLGETQVLTDLQQNPKAAQEHVKNPMVMGRIQKLVSAGIVQVRSCCRPPCTKFCRIAISQSPVVSH
jgi:hypothetical protein